MKCRSLEHQLPETLWLHLLLDFAHESFGLVLIVLLLNP